MVFIIYQPLKGIDPEQHRELVTNVTRIVSLGTQLLTENYKSWLENHLFKKQWEFNDMF